MSTRVIRIIWAVAGAVVLLTLIWFSRRVILLLFAGFLIALILTSLTALLRKVVPVGHKLGYFFVLLIIAGVVWVAGVLVAPSVADQFGELANRLPKLFGDLRERVQQSSVYQEIEGALPKAKELIPSSGATRVTQVFSSTFEAASAFAFIVFSALFLAGSPEVYKKLLIKLFPPRLRGDAKETLARVTCTLKYWLLGQGLAMAVVGILTGTSLAIAGVPLAVALGILAGLAEFIPIIGPIAASIPALLLALSLGSQKFLIVLVIFLVIQFLEGYIIMPLAQRQTVDLPPVITLLALLLLGGSFGLLGMFVAAPLAAVALVLAEDVYLQRYLKTKDKLLT